MKKIISYITVILLVLTITGCGNKKETIDPKVRVNSNEGVISEKKLDDFTFTNTSLLMENGSSKLTTTVTNKGTEEKTIETFKIILKNKSGKVIKEMTGYVGGTIKPNASKTIITYINIDLTEISDIEYTY